MDVPFRPAAGQIIAEQFRLEKKLGEGGMGELYLARQLELNRLVVLKFVHAQLASARPESAQRLRREAQAIAQINHPNVVQLYTVGQEQGQAFLVMEYVQGRTLAEELALGALPEARALHIAKQIAAGLSAAHQRGIVHRDLKPENVMLTSQGGDHDHVKLVDFGIARLVAEERERLTRTGLVIGTPQYMAPEQIAKNQSDERSDIYCFGLIFYELLTGITTFSGDTPYELLSQHVESDVVAPSLRAPGVAPALEAIVMQCLEKDPAQRFTNAEELRRALLLAPYEAGEEEEPPQLRARLLRDETPRPRPALPSSRPLATNEEDERATARREPRAAGPFSLSLLFTRLLRYGGLAVALAASWNAVDKLRLLPRNPLERLLTRLEQRLEQEEADASSPGAHDGLSSSLAGALRTAGHALESELEKQLAEAATCLNGNADRGYDSYYRYDSWVDLARGPTGKERIVYGLYTLTGPDHCPEEPLQGQDGELRAHVATFARAVHALDHETTQADRYYEQEDYKDDGMRRGQSLHEPLLTAFRAFAESERALRSLVATRRDEQDRALLAGLSAGPERAFHELRIGAQSLLRLGLRAPAELAQLAPDEFKRAVEAYASALTAAEARLDGELQRSAHTLQETAKKLLRHLGPKPGWSPGDRMNLDDRLAGWMVEGSPYRLLRDGEQLASAMNRSAWLEERGIVLVEPAIAYAPK